ncbi:uncharacterized protein BO97DRAFT_476379 [Aspergillus homomorphus CBS 101889]|uniref:Chitin-binding type-1 domain-containing protein n=1 Tax=Aspergillus homomorphus (strain CBS 101889) TaxID=1450537 RepID=A0A395I5E8_ASPHC|nr:hypothetical protein BO97DRAFT_476379 [Aspergillus homomorphus CBS 101889]RAL14996.1 hypothetical protein BO97DRAFT_476379 [Aspergillus homomorphus CBS 101889]
MNPTSTDGNCGANSETNATCLNSNYGNCCSAKGYCGSTSAYCGDGCNAHFGTCTSQPNNTNTNTNAPTTQQQPVSTDGNCGPNSSTKNATCLTSPYGDCCSAKGYCGSTSAYCGDGCNALFGTCDDPTTQTVSTSGSCGGTANSNVTCLGSEFGDCCSKLGYCGRNDAYCGVGCQVGFGVCDRSGTGTATRTATGTATATATASQRASTDGACGVGVTCVGSEWGDCCSGHGWCGGNGTYCGAGCQAEFGVCDGDLSSGEGGLGKGAIAGISVGAAVAACIVLALIGFWLFRRRKSRAPGMIDGSSGLQEPKMPPEIMPAQSSEQAAKLYPYPVEAMGQPAKSLVEIGQTHVMGELDGRSVLEPVELPAHR